MVTSRCGLLFSIDARWMHWSKLVVSTVEIHP